MNTDQSQHTIPTGTLTFLFTDIEGSTVRWEHQREAMAAALVRHDVLVRGAIESHGGHVFKTGGDAFCAAFANAADGLAAALDAQRALAAEDWSALGEEGRQEGGHGDPLLRSHADSNESDASSGFAPLRVRMGLHHGQAGARGGDYFGPALNRTARLMAAGHGGQVLLSRAVHEAVAERMPSGCRLRDLGEHRLKDLRHSERVYQLVADGLPDVVKSLNTAGALSARDQIVVTDPEAASSDTVDADAVVVERSVPETLASLQAVIRGDARTLVLTVPQVRAVAQHKPADLTEYRLGRIAEWSQPRYRLDGRFVALTLLIDQGEESVSGRWAAKPERYEDLGALLAGVPDPAVVVLGPPGSGKSTILRHLELDTAIANLRGEDDRDAVTLFVQLNQYRARSNEPLPDPDQWLSEQWAAAYPDLPTLDALLVQGRLTLLLDALNEMPASNEGEFRERVARWKDWLVRLAKEHPGNRVVFSCRTLDYSASLSTTVLRVPQVQIEPLSDEQVHEFLGTYSPVRGEDIWATIARTVQLDALRSPFFLALLVDQVEATGDLAGDRAGLFTGFVRQALRREVEQDNPLFAVEELLSSRDIRRIAQWQWRDAYELPERGALVPKLSALAYGMQESEADGGSSQVRVDYDKALEILAHRQDAQIVKSGIAISVLDEDPARDEVLYRHQLLQEYFAARVLAREPNPSLVAATWRAADIRPGLREILETLLPAETLPALPTTGWEESTVLAAAMAPEPESFIRAVMPANLVVAGRAANLPTVRSKLSDAFLDELRWALVARSRDAEADLRARIDAGLALGWLGDPRFERRMGPHGEYLVPPMVAIPGGVYPIGDDEPIEEGHTNTDHMPRHTVQLGGYDIGQFAVTNAEYACFIAAGGYEAERWWETESARSWRRGDGTAEGSKRNHRWWWREFRAHPDRLATYIEEGRVDDAVAERWQVWVAMDEADFEAAIAVRFPGGRLTEPQYWLDLLYNNPAQPVVGVCWYEARAYCAWLTAQTAVAYALPTEVEREAATRGHAGRHFAYGDAFDPLTANTFATHLKRPSPVGVFVEGDTPEGASDLTGNSADWTSSLYRRTDDDDDEAKCWYPYDATDGREDASVNSDVQRVLRGGSWANPLEGTWAVYRYSGRPGNSGPSSGFRLRSTVPTPKDARSPADRAALQ